jgi:hypothetical protein
MTWRRVISLLSREHNEEHAAHDYRIRRLEERVRFLEAMYGAASQGKPGDCRIDVQGSNRG